MKAYFMNEIFELPSEIEGLRKQVCDRSNNKNNVYDDNNLKILEVHNSILQQENQLGKHELQQKQSVIEKQLLDIKENRLKNNYFNTDGNNTNLKSNRLYDFQNKKQNESNKEKKPIKDVKVNPSNSTGRNKVVVIGDSMVKYLKPNDLASRENFVKVSTQSGSLTEDMLDYIKPVVKKKPDTVIIHTDTNDLTNCVKTMNKIKKLVQYIRQNGKDKSILIDFSSIIYREDRNFSYLNINSIRNKFENLKEIIDSNIDALFVAETKIDSFFCNRSVSPRRISFTILLRCKQ